MTTFLDLPFPALARALEPKQVLNLIKTCKALKDGFDTEVVWHILSTRIWPAKTLRCPPYSSTKALVVDGNRANAELAIDLQGLVSDYRFKQLTFWYQCRLIRLLWRRGGAQESLRLLIDARGERDLRFPYSRRGGCSSLVVVELEDECPATAGVSAVPGQQQQQQEQQHAANPEAVQGLYGPQHAVACIEDLLANVPGLQLVIQEQAAGGGFEDAAGAGDGGEDALEAWQEGGAGLPEAADEAPAPEAAAEAADEAQALEVAAGSEALDEDEHDAGEGAGDAPDDILGMDDAEDGPIPLAGWEAIMLAAHHVQVAPPWVEPQPGQASTQLPETPQPAMLQRARPPGGGGGGPPLQQGVGAVAADEFEAALEGQSTLGHFEGTLVWGPEKTERIVQLLESWDDDGDGGEGGSDGRGGSSRDANRPGGRQRLRRRVLLFCYTNRLDEIGHTQGAERWCDYTLVPLLEVAEGQTVREAWAASERCAGYDTIGAAEAALASEAPERQRERWRDVPPGVLARGWWA